MNKDYEQCQELKKMFLECTHKNTLSQVNLSEAKTKQLKCQEYLINQQKRVHNQNWDYLLVNLLTSS